MKKIIILSAIFLVLIQGLVNGQNITCVTSAPICTGPTYTYPAGTSGTAEPGAYYGCLSTQPAYITFSQSAGTGSLDCSITGGLNAGFSAAPLAGTAPLPVQFTDESTGYPTIWKWDFENDGLYDSFIQDPSFTYAQPGTYSVKLFVQNETEMDSIVKVEYITVDSSINCGELITVDHIAGNIAPVTKTTTYGTVSNVAGEPAKCWMTSNLGADHQAIDAHDTTEASAGWYWQFNRMQGFMHDGTTRTPDTEWISYIDEDSDWLPANDPCNLEIGNGWRIPTQSEWVNVNDAGGWTNWVEPWESPLKLHTGGFLEESDGSLHMRGEGGAFWSNLQGSNTTAWHERFNDTLCGYAGHYKARGYSLRCVKDEPVIASPEICIVSVTPDNHNQVIWEKQASGQIESYYIYRETAQTNVYELIGLVSYSDSSIFTDVSSNPQQRPFKYKLSAVTYSGTETALSNYHKTIHLTINEGPAGWNLIWSAYEGFTFSTYYIYRGAEPGALELLDSISGSFTSYTDIDPPSGPLYYAIEIINEEGCFPTRDNGYDRSRSNVQYNGVVGIEDNTETGVSIYPNPARDVLNIQLEGNNVDAALTIYDAHGKTMVSKQLQQRNTAIRIDDLTPGVYMIRLEYAQKVLIRKLVVY